ncbi:MAG: AAA family ATPase [Clostridia bacterium]|nr:AAA family ATPase [Clostridia bacterium]
MEYGLIGAKLSHSFSKEIHEQLADYKYELKELTLEQVPDFIKNKSFKAINVTIPYKETVMPYLDVISDMAKKIGSVNTIVNKNGKLYGYNTDYYGFSYMLEYGKISVKNKVVAVLGSGGASKTVVATLNDLGAKRVIIVSRSGEVNYSNISNVKDVNVIVNASPVGMYPNVGECLVDLDSFPNLEGIADLVYNPSLTEILRRAKAKGIAYVNGLSMLVAQAKKACELFIDIKIDDDKIDRITEAVAFKTRNIVFVGMPGCGKSTLAKILAQNLGREFVDTDEEFERTFDISPADCIKNNGEQDFRNKESCVVANVCKQSKKIIATGGGAVIREENRIAMKQNATVIWIDRPLEVLATNGRPLSGDIDRLKTLYETRKKYYNDVSDIKIDNSGSLYDSIFQIENALNISAKE